MPPQKIGEMERIQYEGQFLPLLPPWMRGAAAPPASQNRRRCSQINVNKIISHLELSSFGGEARENCWWGAQPQVGCVVLLVVHNQSGCVNVVLLIKLPLSLISNTTLTSTNAIPTSYILGGGCGTPRPSMATPLSSMEL